MPVTVTQTLLDTLANNQSSGFINDIPIKLGDVFSTGRFKIVVNDGYKYGSVYSSSASGSMRLYTTSTDGTYATSTDTNHAFNNLKINLVNSRVTQTLLDEMGGQVKGFINDAPMKLGNIYKTGIVKFVANDGYIITGVTATNPTMGSAIGYALSSDKLTATVSDAYALNKVYIDTQVLTPEVLGVNKVYKIEPSDIPTLITKKFQFFNGSTTIQYGQNILGLIELPFPIPSDMSNSTGNVKLGDLDTGIVATILNDDLLTVNMGSITIPKTFNNSLDFLNTFCTLNLPYCEPFTIANEYLIGETINIFYDIDLYTGEALIRITSTKTGNSVVTKNIDLNINIPFGDVQDRPIQNSVNNLELGGYNGVKTPFIEVMRNDAILPKGFFTIPVSDEKPLQGEKGFLKIDEIELNVNAHDNEREHIISLLANGVIIK